MIKCLKVGWPDTLAAHSGKKVGGPIASAAYGDKGTKFLNSTFQSMLRRRGIKFYTSENEDLKAPVVERFNRTLKTIM